MSSIKEIYIDGLLRKDYKTADVYISGKRIRSNSKFNIFNRRILDLDQSSNFTIIYTLSILKAEKKEQNDEQQMDKTRTDKSDVGLPVKEPTKNKSSILINGTDASDSQTFVRIDGLLITDNSVIELFLDGKKIKDSAITIVFDVTKDNLLKYTRRLKPKRI